MKQSKFTINVFANYIGRTWAIASVYIFIPLYISLLGIESYGVVAFFGTITGIIALADFGLTTTFSRELAKPSPAIYKASLFQTLALIYGGLILFVVAIFIFFSSTIADSWLHSETLSSSYLSKAVRLMGIASGFQLLASFFLGGLIGLEKQVTSNLLQFVWGVFRAAGSLIVITLSPTITAFLYWHIASNILYLFFCWFFLKKSLDSTVGKVDFRLVKDHYSFASGMMVISLISSLNWQIDKLLVSKFLNVTYFGYYTVGATLAQIPIILATPISNALFPRLTSLFAEGMKEKIWELYSLIGFFISVLIIPISCACALFSEEIIYFWTSDADLSATLKGVSRWLVIGSIFQALQIMPFNLSLAYGYTRATLVLVVTFFTTISISLVVLIPVYKLEGAALAWLLTNVILTIPYILFINRKILPDRSRLYMVKSIGTVFFPSVGIFLLLRWLVTNTPSLIPIAIICGLLISGATSFYLFFRTTPVNMIKKIKILLTNS